MALGDLGSLLRGIGRGSWCITPCTGLGFGFGWSQVLALRRFDWIVLVAGAFEHIGIAVRWRMWAGFRIALYAAP